MKRGKSRKRFGLHILSVLALMLAFCLPVSAGVKEGDGEYEIYPTPQSVTYGAGSAALTDKVNVKLGDPMLADILVRQPGYFYGYHITRSSWISILLDGTVPFAEIFRWIDESYAVTAPKKTGKRR